MQGSSNNKLIPTAKRVRKKTDFYIYAQVVKLAGRRAWKRDQPFVLMKERRMNGPKKKVIILSHPEILRN